MAKYIILGALGVLLLVFPLKRVKKKSIVIPVRVVGGVLLAAALIWYFAPRGKNSIFGEAGIGSGVGAYDASTESTEETGTELDDKEIELVVSEASGDLTVTVRETEVYYDQHLCEDMETLKTLLEGTDLTGRELYLADDYAVANVYHEVERVMEELSLNPIRIMAEERE
ncbi:MAG: hypothetical protein IJT05_01420 [Lachnospiraceae bacterium]|nr:hypothetical protein [Lachnospiraceae bacterium]